MEILYPSTWIKVLVLPVGRIRTSVFREYYSSLSTSSSKIPHSELVIDAISPGEEKNEFTNFQFQDGVIKFDFCIEHDDEWMALEEFQKWKSVLAVIGMVHADEMEPSVFEDIYADFRSHILSKFQSALVHKCLVFSNTPLSMSPSQGIHIINTQDDLNNQFRQFAMNLSISLVKAFRDMASAIELRSVIHSPPESVLGYQGEPTYDFPLPVSSSLPTASGLNTSPFPQGANLISQEARLKKRASGRAQKLVADLLVLSGHLPSAVSNYLNAIEAAKSQSDLLWLASSLDGLHSALLAWHDLSSSSSSSSPNSFSSSSSSLFTSFPEYVKEWVHGVTPLEIEQKYRELLYFYERGEAPLLVAEIGLRLSEYLFCTKASLPGDIAGLLTTSLSRCQGLSLRFQLQFYLKATMLFEQLKFPRKQAFFLMASVQLIVQILASYGSQVVPVAQFQLMEKLARLYGLLSLDHVGWDMLQMKVLDQCILLAEAVEDPSSLTLLIVKCFQRFQKMLSLDGMMEIVTRLQKSSKESKQLNSTPLRQFSFLKSVRAIPLPPALQPRKFVDNPETSGVFLYSHFTKDSDKADTFYVSDEPIEFECTLSNPFSFQVFLDSFALLTDGIDFVSDRVNLMLNAQGKVTFRISGLPKVAGSLKVIGCEFKIFGVTEQSVISTAVSMEEVKQKKNYLQTIETPVTLPKLSNVILELEVLPSLPLIQLSMPQIYHSRIMLLEGQTSTTSLLLHNSSDLPVTSLEINFKEVRQCPPFEEGNRMDVYYHEWYDLQYSFMKCTSIPSSIAPGETVSLNIDLFGKAYCSEVTVLVAYSNGTFNYRQSMYNIITTLGSDVMIADFDITTSLVSQTVLVHFDFLNQHLVPITVTLSSPLDTVIATLQPNCTKRCVLPISLCSLSQAQLLVPIPTLKQKQFIVSKQSTNAYELRERTMCFWLKQFILEQVKATWKSFDQCEGILNLSNIQLIPEHIPLLWEHSVTVSLTNIDFSDCPNIQSITLSVTNKAISEQSFLIQLQPNSDNIKLLSTSFHTMHLVPPNETRDLTLPVFNPRCEPFSLLCHTTRMGEDSDKMTSYCELNITCPEASRPSA